jgi:hypothetical protein
MEMIESNLMELFKFTPDDLQANRHGQLSPAQQARWADAGQWAGSMTTTAVPLIVSLFIAIIGIIISVIVGQPVLGSVISLVVAGVVGVGLRMRARRSIQDEASVSVTAVRCAEGVAHLRETMDRSEHETSRRYKLEIEHHVFQLFRKEQFEGLENGARYIVYYLDDDDKYIVSLEKAN